MEQPDRITDLKVSQVERTFELSFTLPARATDGERLTKPLEVWIFRTVTPAGEKLPNTPAAQDPWVVLHADDLPRLARGDQVVLPAPLPDSEFKQWQGASFTFAVRALTRGFRRHAVESELSNLAHAILLDVPGPVENLEVQTTEKALDLHWSPPSRSQGEGAPPAASAYRVYRSRTGEPGSFRLRGETDLPTYVEADFQFGNTYFFKVRAVLRQSGQVAESEDSSMVEVTPRDHFPPRAPTALTALYTGGAVELLWTASLEPDLAGYNVYRRTEGDSLRRANDVLLRTPIFRDLSVEPDRRHFYCVTAVDLEKNESPPSAEVEVASR